ncbi:MAG: 1-acyl-sn-glycerol-3-phosphate acyltransferase [Clostridiales bacterium]|nr:1-acyl-sn-glycerol-3-phosphate acyltransferase [Clostridiales bacterium]
MDKNINLSKYAKQSHKILLPIVRFFSFLYTRIFLGYRCKDKYKIKKGESVLVLSNHQTDEDPICIITAFDKPVYPVATDNIFSGKFLYKLFTYCSVIPKSKGKPDFRAVMRMIQYLNDGKSVLLFPEGNRYYAEFQYYITPDFPLLLKRTNATIVIFNMHGGSGVSPRFKNKKRHGPFYGNIQYVLSHDQYSHMKDEDILSVITENLRVFDSESGNKYKSSKRAEYIERMLFCCPKCGKFETIYSKGSHFYCNSCNMSAEFGEDLMIHGIDGINKLIDFWEYQKKAVREMAVVPGKVIFHDENVKLFDSKPFNEKTEICKGELSLTDSVLQCGNQSFDVNKITSASIVSGRNLVFQYNDNDYTLRGGKRFNPIKYIFAFHKLDTEMQRTGIDKYYDIWS